MLEMTPNSAMILVIPVRVVLKMNAKDAAMSIEAESAVLFISVRSNGSNATTLLPAH